MTDILIRDVPDEVVAALDASARRLGISRVELARRQLAQVTAEQPRCTIEDLERFAEHFADLADPEVMDRAWNR